MNPPELKPELLELCDRLLDGDLSEADRARLEKMVIDDPETRRLYVDYLHLHGSLRQSSSSFGALPVAEAMASFPGNVSPAPTRNPWRWPLELAALIVFGLALWWISWQGPETSYAQIVENHGVQWESSSLPTTTGVPLKGGHLKLAQGVARLLFASGAQVSLEGPAELEITGPNACHLHSGSLVAHVPEQARGFAVKTASAQLIDHGTDFGIHAGPAGQAAVRVMQGEVELHHASTGGKLRLTTAESAIVTPEQLSSAATHDEGESDRSAFLKSGAAPATKVSLTTASGAGDAAYVVSPNSPLHHSETLLLVKNCPEERYRRKAYLKFDRTALAQQKITEATLSLNFEASGFGFASLTDETVFTVYGVTNDSMDAWTRQTLQWENAPAFSPDGGTVDTAHATRLGSFALPRGVVSGAFGIEGKALTDFLNRDQNQLCTLVVVRETSIPRDAVVHGFAGNFHPRLAPPTLQLVLAD